MRKNQGIDFTGSTNLPKYRNGNVWVGTAEDIVRLPLEVIRLVVIGEQYTVTTGVCGICKNRNKVKKFQERASGPWINLCKSCYDQEHPEFKQLFSDNSVEITLDCI